MLPKPIQTSLDSQIIAALNLNGLNAGRHVLRDERNWKIGEYWVTGIWVVYILPSFHSPAALAIVYEEEKIRGVFVTSQGTPQIVETTSAVSIEFKSDWPDPVANILRQCDLLNFNGGISLDGIGYVLQVDTLASRTSISFFNPTTHPLIELGELFFEIASEIVHQVGGSLEKAYLDTWRGYFGK
jgi:hypothetical protein